MLSNIKSDTISHFSDLASVAKSISGLEYFFLTSNGTDVYGNMPEHSTDILSEAEFDSLLSNSREKTSQNNLAFDTFLASDFSYLKPYKTFYTFAIQNDSDGVSALLGLLDKDEKPLQASQIEAIGQLCSQIGKLNKEWSCTELQNFSEIFELSEDLICICGLDGNLENVNPSFERILGWKNEEILGKLLYDFVHKKDKWYTKAKLGSLLKGASRIGFTHRLRTAKNDFKTIEWVATIVPTTRKVSAIGRDITEQLDKQQKLLQSEKKFKLFFENSQGLMCTHDLAGKFISVNVSGAKILGYTKVELDGYSLYDIVPRNRHIYLDQYLQLIQKQGFAKGQMLTSAKDGSERTWMFSNVVQEDDTGGFYVIGNAVDITEQHALEKDLLRTKSILEQTNKVAKVGGWEMDMATNKIEWTSITREIHEVDESFVPDISVAISFYKPGESREKIEKAFQNNVTTGEPYDLELEITTAKGRDIWVRAIGNAVFQDGVCTRLYGTFQDIDEHKKSEIALAESKKLLDDVLNAASDLCIIATDLNGIITVFNTGAESLLGYAAAEMIGKQNPEMLYIRHEIESQEPAVKVFENDLIGFEYFLEISKKNSSAKHELSFVSKTGNKFDVSLIVSLITNPQGEVIGFLGVATDITNQNKMEEALSTERARLLAFIEHTPAAVAMLDNDMKYLAVSQKWIDDYKFKTNDLIGASHYQMFPNLDEERKARHKEILKGKIDRREEDIFIDSQTDEKHFITMEMRPWYRSEAEIGGMMIFTQDISGMIAQREELRTAKIHADEANLAKSEFLANMSHEIRTPLNGVIGFTDLVLKTKLDEIQQQYLKIVSQSAGALLNIINDILDFSKIEAGKFELDIDKCDLYEMTCQATDITTYQIQSKNLEMLLNLSPQLPRFVWADDVRLKQVITNLLGNAAKFTERGEIELKVEILEEDTKKCMFRFSIRDTGIGIQADKQDKIFEAFAQEDSSTTKKYGGTGLGLTISNKLLRMMGSRLELLSESGKGSTFYFDIWLECEKGDAIEWKEIDAVKNVLIVDDNDNNRNFLRDMLNLKGINTDLAKSGFEALQYLAEGRLYDAVLMDYHMPFMDGLETIDKIRKSFFESHESLPILLLHSSADDNTLITSSKTLHVNRRLVKPIKMPDLYDALSKLHIKQDVETNVASNKKEPKAVIRTDTGKVKILIVEDNEVNRFLTRSLISDMLDGIEIIEANNGKDGLECFIKHAPNLILMDVQMPVMNGLQATKAIRELETEKHTPIIAVTAGNVSGEREKCLDAGMNDFITKPIFQGALELVINKWMGKLTDDKPIAIESDAEGDEHFDPSRLSIYYGENKEKLAKIASLTIMQLEEVAEQLKELAKIGDIENIQLLGHKIYGTSSSAGLMLLQKYSSKLEAITQVDFPMLADLTNDFIDEVLILKKILTEKYL
ncbi:PAS domain S-box protein [Pedobacter jamesrossensis]|uniref:histidine kinase n=1 Tax=Pedobacter jamesrossensis TaxID=1908238 RepID=A0ABV8NJ71_9SPHI